MAHLVHICKNLGHSAALHSSLLDDTGMSFSVADYICLYLMIFSSVSYIR